MSDSSIDDNKPELPRPDLTFSPPSRSASVSSNDGKEGKTTRPTSDQKKFVVLPSATQNSNQPGSSYGPEFGNQKNTRVCVSASADLFTCEDLASCDNSHVKRLLQAAQQLRHSKQFHGHPTATRTALTRMVEDANSKMTHDWEQEARKDPGTTRITIELMPDLGDDEEDPRKVFRDGPGILQDYSFVQAKLREEETGSF
jgi:hypothetical protein